MSTLIFAPLGQPKLQRAAPLQFSVFRRRLFIGIPSFAAPSTKSSVPRERMWSGTVSTCTRCSTSSKYGASASAVIPVSPRSWDQPWSTSSGTRKHTPPVSTLEPPTHLPAITAMSGVSPTPTAVQRPASRAMRRIDCDGVIAPYSSGVKCPLPRESRR